MAISGIHNWVIFKEPLEHFHAAFPHQPVQMEFDLTKEDALTGSLHVYTASLPQGTLMVTTLSSPSLAKLGKQDLTEETFKNIFYSCLIRRIFYEPHLFKQSSHFLTKQIDFERQPALQFSITYSSPRDEQVLSGFTVLKNQKLYSVFYITSKQNKSTDEFNYFIHSFHI